MTPTKAQRLATQGDLDRCTAITVSQHGQIARLTEERDAALALCSLSREGISADDIEAVVALLNIRQAMRAYDANGMDGSNQ